MTEISCRMAGFCDATQRGLASWTTMDQGPGRTDRPLTVVLGVLLTLAASSTAVALRPEGAHVANWWPPLGIAVGTMLLVRRSWWGPTALGIVLASGAGNVIGDRPLALATAFSVVNATEALLAALVLTEFGRVRAALDSQRDVIRLIFASGVVGTLGAFGVATMSALVGPGYGVDIFVTLLPAHVASILVIVPLVLVWQQRLEFAAPLTWSLLTAGAVAATIFAFWPHQSPTLVPAPFAFLVWTAVQCGRKGIVWQLLLVAVTASVMGTHPDSPFASLGASAMNAPTGANALVQTYLVCVVLVALPLAVGTEESRRLVERVEAAAALLKRNFTDSIVAMVLLRVQDGEPVIVDLNDTACTLLDGRRDELLGTPLSGVLTLGETGGPTVGQVAREGLDGWRVEGTVLRRPGTRIAAALSRLTEDDDGVMLSAQLLDLTAERIVTARLDREREMATRTQDTAACMILLTDLHGTITRANAATYALTGRPADDVLGRPIWEVVALPERAHEVEAMFGDPRGLAVPSGTETDIRRADGRELRIQWRNSVISDPDGAPAHVVMTGVDVTAERHATSQMRHMLEAATTTMFVGLDLDGTISSFNAGAESILGRHATDVIGLPFTDLLHPGDLRRWVEARRHGPGFASFAGEIGDTEPCSGDWNWIRGNGATAIVSMTLSAVRRPSGERVGYLCVGRDVTETMRTQQRVRHALEKERRAGERLKQLDEAKDDFITTVSHELRTPVTTMVGYAEILADGTLCAPLPQQVGPLRAIERSGRRLISLADNLLTLASIQSADHEWDRHEVDLASVVRLSQERLCGALEGRRLSVTFDLAQSPVPVEGDAVYLGRAVDNLLSNAVKFTPDGGSVTCTLTTEGGVAVLCVADTGMGIPEHERKLMFATFARSSTAHHAAVQGPGLGLTIVSAVVAAHGGTVELSSTERVGTTFRLSLPMVPVPAPAAC